MKVKGHIEKTKGRQDHPEVRIQGQGHIELKESHTRLEQEVNSR